jgi:hypothetical protein
MFKLPNPSGPLTSNFSAVQQCWKYRRTKRVKPRPNTLPDPSEVRLRFEISRLKADLARAPWLEARIAQLEVETGRRPA